MLIPTGHTQRMGGAGGPGPGGAPFLAVSRMEGMVGGSEGLGCYRNETTRTAIGKVRRGVHVAEEEAAGRTNKASIADAVADGSRSSDPPVC